MENRDNIEDVLHSIIRILNMGITYGDTFLPDPPSYDNLFYEIVRSAEVFEQVTLKGEKSDAYCVIKPSNYNRLRI